jgi:hypothetical protein
MPHARVDPSVHSWPPAVRAYWTSTIISEFFLSSRVSKRFHTALQRLIDSLAPRYEAVEQSINYRESNWNC